MRSIILLIGLMSIAVAAHADIYEWTDSQGGVHYTDDLHNVPAKFKNKVRKVEVQPTIEKGSGGAPPPSAAPPPMKQAALYGGHDEMWWRSSFKNLHDEIKTLQDGLPAKREKALAQHRKYVIFSKPSDRVAENGMNAEIANDQQRIEALQKQLADLDSEATRAGVPMEWRQ